LQQKTGRATRGEFLVIEDSPAGVKAARMVVIAVATTLTRRGLRESGVLENLNGWWRSPGRCPPWCVGG
jgi:beta-phosphoglucomutase-like phosphatase (HAD superfamily)